MRISRKWLNQYVGITLPDEVLAEKLTMAGLEVESIESHADQLRGIVVGEVRSVEQHPNARKLTVCRVFNGNNEVQVVCGAPNVATGQKVAFAPAGSTVPRNQHDPEGQPFTLGSIRIRGVESSGMICSGFELAISDDTEGILVLRSDAIPGRPLSVELGLDEAVYEIGVTANRPDLLSHIGVAREVAALTGKKLRIPSVSCRETGKHVKSVLSVTLEDSVNCPRYSARVVFDISVGPSPAWLQEYLTSVNVRPLNNVVDITNYVLMETGQPLHAFDYDKITGGEIVVRCPRAGETSFLTLDQKKRELTPDTLLICDRSGPVAIGGVMGGENSEISETTTRIVIESAHFSPAGIRRTSKRLGISTEASQRFERGADPGITAMAVDRAAQMVSEIAGGKILKGRIDEYPRRIKQAVIQFDVENSNKLLGITIDIKRISTLLKRIGIIRKSGGSRGTAHFIAPSWRPDLSREVDLIEEVARLHGYEKIGSDVRVRFPLSDTPPGTDPADRLRDYLSACGYLEMITNSMQDEKTAGIAGAHFVGIANPISKEMTSLRTSLLPGLLSTIKHNIYHGTLSSRFYEIGSVFQKKPGGDPDTLSTYTEEQRLIVGTYGKEFPSFWNEKARPVDIYTLKGEANALLSQIFLDNPSYIAYPDSTALTERSIFIEIRGERAGLLGMVSRELLKRYDIETDVFFLDLSLDALKNRKSRDLRFRAFSRYPAVTRDIAVIVDESVPAGSIERVIRDAAGSLLADITLFDIYRGDQAGPGKKSCAFSLEFVSPDHTLDQKDIQGVMENVTGSLEKSFKAALRQ